MKFEHVEAIEIVNTLHKDSKVFQGLTMGHHAWPASTCRHNLANLLDAIAEGLRNAPQRDLFEKQPPAVVEEPEASAPVVEGEPKSDAELRDMLHRLNLMVTEKMISEWTPEDKQLVTDYVLARVMYENDSSVIVPDRPDCLLYALGDYERENGIEPETDESEESADESAEGESAAVVDATTPAQS